MPPIQRDLIKRHLYDTRHVVFEPARISPEVLEAGCWRAYQDFYRWGSIFRGAASKTGLARQIRHVAYAGGWKKFEPLWDLVIRTKRVSSLLPVLETVLAVLAERSPEPAPTLRTESQ